MEDSNNNLTPVTPPDSPVGTVVKLPKAPNSPDKSKTLWPVIFSVLAALILLVVGLWFAKSDNHKGTAQVVKKDIPLIHYTTGERGYNVFYPATDDSQNFIEVNRMIFEGLVQYENKTKIVPMLATSWTNPDLNTWVFKLKSGVKFHDGKEMTATDVKASFEGAKGTYSGDSYGSTIKTITVVSPYEIKIETDGPDPLLLNRLTKYYVYDTKSGKSNDPINGTGPYVIKPGTTPSNDKAELVAFDKYHGGHVYTRALTFEYLIDDKIATEFNSGAFNWVGNIYTIGKPYKLTRPYKTSLRDQTSNFLIVPNTLKTGSPLSKLKVRQAIALGVDPLALAKVRSDPGKTASQILPPSIPGYEPSLTREARDITKAKALLTEAGYPKGFSIGFTYFSGSQSTADEIARQFAEIGITLKFDPQTVIKDLGAKAFGGKADMFAITAGSDLIDGSDVFNLYFTGKNYANDQISKLLDESNKTLDPSQRLKQLQQISKIGTADLGVIPMYIPDPGVDSYDANFVVRRDVPGNDNGVYFWKVYSK